LRILSRALLATKGEALRAECALKKLPRSQKLRWCAQGLQHFIATAASPGSAASPA
jgi:predicted GIY-YIG superfamily endonuclease